MHTLIIKRRGNIVNFFTGAESVSYQETGSSILASRRILGLVKMSDSSSPAPENSDPCAFGSSLKPMQGIRGNGELFSRPQDDFVDEGGIGLARFRHRGLDLRG